MHRRVFPFLLLGVGGRRMARCSTCGHPTPDEYCSDSCKLLNLDDVFWNRVRRKVMRHLKATELSIAQTKELVVYGKIEVYMPTALKYPSDVSTTSYPLNLGAGHPLGIRIAGLL